MPLRIGLVSAEYPPAIGGVGDHTARLAKELLEAGQTVEVLTSDRIRRWDWRILWQIPTVAKQRGWDVLHIQYQPAAYGLHVAVNVLPWARRRPGPTVVTTFHDLRVPYLFPKAGPLRRAAVAALAKGSDAVIAVADSDLPRLRRWRAGRPPATTQHVPLGDQLDARLPDGYARAVWRAKLGLARDEPVVAHFGLINRSKGVLELLEALGDLETARLVMIGEPLGGADPTNADYLAEVHATIGRLGLTQRVHWTGYVSPSELVAWLGCADVVALPFADGASLRRTSLITAWCRGLPVVTTEPSDSPEWRRTPPGEDAARYVPPGDVESLGVALREALSSSEFRDALVQNARLFAERFSWRSVVAQTLAVYEAALTARRA